MVLTIPPKKMLQMTNVEDPIDYYYYPIIGYFYRERLRTVLRLMGKKVFNTLIDVGYGCGLLFPTLKHYTHQLYGVELHDKGEQVKKAMKKLNVDVTLFRKNILELGTLERTFDAIVCVSILEHIKKVNEAVEQLAAVQKKGDSLFVGSPVKNKITDLVFTLFRFDYKKHHPSTHHDIINAVKQRYKITKLTTFPRWIPIDYALYFALVGVKK